tara:strand:+ start:167 stop:442 length:276 start_codon:yes stop_codon:yes gene_type:complete
VRIESKHSLAKAIDYSKLKVLRLNKRFLMSKIKIFAVLFFALSLSSCSYIAEKKDKWFGDDEPEYTAPVVEVVEPVVEPVAVDSEESSIEE